MSPAEDNRNVVTKIGTVRSDKMDKTIVVSIERRLLHPLYKKYIKRYTKLVAHDESNEAKVGDTVEVRFTRPISKNKRWRLEKVLVTADGGGAA
jgi:small subunit ribosomal protein S17